MNWTEIAEKYPKGAELLQDFIDGTCYMPADSNYKDQWCGSYLRIFVRKLYDFFDEQGIYVDVRPFYYDQLFFITGILTFVTDVAIDWTEKADTRTEAEEKAFEKAFEILEDKL